MTLGSSGGEVLKPSFVSEPTFVRTLEGLIEPETHKPTGEVYFVWSVSSHLLHFLLTGLFIEKVGELFIGGHHFLSVLF